MSYEWLPTHYLGPAPAVPGNLPRLPAMSWNAITASSAPSLHPATTSISMQGHLYSSNSSSASSTFTSSPGYRSMHVTRQAPKSILRSPDSSYYSSTTSSSRSGNSSDGLGGQLKGLASPRRVSFTRDTKMDTSMRPQLARSQDGGRSGRYSLGSSSRNGHGKQKNYSRHSSGSSAVKSRTNSRHAGAFFSSSNDSQHHRSSYSRSNVVASQDKKMDHQSAFFNSRRQRSMSSENTHSSRKTTRSSRTH